VRSRSLIKDVIATGRIGSVSRTKTLDMAHERKETSTNGRRDILITSLIKPPVYPLLVLLVISIIATDNLNNEVCSDLNDVLWIPKCTLKMWTRNKVNMPIAPEQV
jgi:hypothetical protein